MSKTRIIYGCMFYTENWEFDKNNGGTWENMGTIINTLRDLKGKGKNNKEIVITSTDFEYTGKIRNEDGNIVRSFSNESVILIGILLAEFESYNSGFTKLPSLHEEAIKRWKEFSEGADNVNLNQKPSVYVFTHNEK
jgi:hypothetical protein